jgi:prepilin-type processing-associated H-X9-DG protein
MNTVVTPNNKLAPWNSCSDTNADGVNMPDYAVYSNGQSNHPGGGNVLMADGSARFIKGTNQQATWYALGTKANGDMVDAAMYGQGPADHATRPGLVFSIQG